MNKKNKYLIKSEEELKKTINAFHKMGYNLFVVEEQK